MPDQHTPLEQLWLLKPGERHNAAHADHFAQLCKPEVTGSIPVRSITDIAQPLTPHRDARTASTCGPYSARDGAHVLESRAGAAQYLIVMPPRVAALVAALHDEAEVGPPGDIFRRFAGELLS
jgi:hypothetical protein